MSAAARLPKENTVNRYQLCLRGLILTGILLLVGCNDAATPNLPELKVSGPTMGTHYAVKVVGDYPGGEAQLQHEVEQILQRIDHQLSTYKPDSELSRFNQHQATTPVEISQDLADVMIEGLRVGKMTGGAMDITVGPLVNLWGFGPDKRPTQIPSDAQIAAARQRIGLDKLHVEIGSEKATVRKDIPDLYVDLSTLGEGYAADKVADWLDEQGIKNYMVEIAGALRLKGHNGQGELWRIAVEKPGDELGLVQEVLTPGDNGISTAGSYRNYYELDGQRFSHIIDPATGKPLTHKLVSVTVIAPTALYTDALDTGLMVMGADKALIFANEHNLPIYTLTKTDDGFKVRYSRAFAAYQPKP
jgi:FAD:protein FMN transferase